MGVHDLRHDGKLFSSGMSFQVCAERINHYLRDWNAEGFRAGAMHHNLEWIGSTDLLYDLSTLTQILLSLSLMVWVRFSFLGKLSGREGMWRFPTL